MSLSTKSNAPASQSLCQLEQPLLMKKPNPKATSQPSIAPASTQFPASSFLPSSMDLPVDYSRSPLSLVGSSSRSQTTVPCPPGFEGIFANPSTENPPVLPHPPDSEFNYQSFSPPTAPPATFFSNEVNTDPKTNSQFQQFTEVPGFTPAYNPSPFIPSAESSIFEMVADSCPKNDFQHSQHMASQDESATNFNYAPVKPHWLFADTVESKEVWCGFSTIDSEKLEAALQRGSESIIPTDGGRYDVYLDLRIKKSVYFDAKDLHVVRGTWFYSSNSSMRFTPYREDVAKKLEQHFSNCVSSGQWQRRFNLPGIGSFVFDTPQVMLHYKNEIEVWPSLPDSKASPKVVKRGLPDGFEILPNESHNVDHLVFIVQGIGSFCDLRFRTVTQCVDGFRDIANKLISSHFKNDTDQGCVGRVEFLPVAWHAKLHTSDVGLDERLQNITLPSIPKLRHFTNDTLIDILLYSSPSYCQSIIDTVACELNKLYELFLHRNPSFCGKVFVAGHSLGSLILFDILANQNSSINELQTEIAIPPKSSNIEQEQLIKEDNNQLLTSKRNPIFEMYTDIAALLSSIDLEKYIETFNKAQIDLDSLLLLSDDQLKAMNVPTDPRKKILNLISSTQQNVEAHEESLNIAMQCQNTAEKTKFIYPEKAPGSGMSLISYPRLKFEPACFFALGSPISMFLAVRGYDAISGDFEFPTCSAFFHIFHPYDPVAFRIEPLIDSSFSAKPVLIPHHKGRKRMHLEIRENVTKIASEIKQKLMDTMRFTWNSLSEFAKNHSFPTAILEAEVDKLVEQEMSVPVDTQETSVEDLQIGRLNGGRRIDYVLQEKPIEALNDYVFALTSHATYWDSEDTVLMILKEIYAMQGIVLTTQPIERKQSIQNTFSEASSSMESSNFVALPDKSVNSYPSFGYSHLFPEQKENLSGPILPCTIDNKSLTGDNSVNSQNPSAIPGSKHIGPPPLSGFVKRSAFTR